MPSPPDPAPPPPLGPLLGRVRRRIRTLRALRTALELALYGSALAALTLLALKSGRLPAHHARSLLALALAMPVAGALWGALRRVPALLAAQLLDRAYALKDRLASAQYFATLDPSERTAWTEAATADATEYVRAHTLDPRRAIAWRWPAESAFTGALCVLVAAISLVEVRVAVPLPLRAVASVVHDPVRLSDDDIAAFREAAQAIRDRVDTPEARRAAEQIEQLLAGVQQGRLERAEAYRRLQALQDALAHGQESERQALRDAMRQRGDRMARADSPLTRELAHALQQSDPRAAAEQMHRLAEQLRNQRLTEQQRTQLRQSLAAAQDRREHEQLEQQLQHAREETERLLRQQREHPLAPQEQRLLAQRQRELERLERQNAQQNAQGRQLQRLDRAMDQAMQDLLRDIGQAAAGQQMEQGAQDLSRMQDEQMNEQQMADLRQQLEDLRDRLRQQNGQGGQQQRQRLQRFAGRAHGGQGQEGAQGQGQRPGRLELGQGGGGDGPTIPIPGGGQSPGQGQQGGQNGNEPGGAQAGTQHVENSRGAAVHTDTHTQQIAVTGQQRGNGPTRAQVIRTAAQSGFTAQGYRAVHETYWDHAREVVRAGEVPPGYRSYVRRYFQLIRPRDGE